MCTLPLLLYVCMVAAGVTVHYVFAVLGILPTERALLTEMVRFKIDYTFWLNLVFTIIGSVLLTLHLRGREEGEGWSAEGGGRAAQGGAS